MQALFTQERHDLNMKQKLNLVIEQIDRLIAKKEQVIIAIDGYCTSGKTTLALALEKQYDCNVFHMDDFFLREEQRTPKRFEQIGGNIDYERFKKEVLIPLKSGKAFTYRPFDCSTFTLGKETEVVPKKLSIVEGTYSLHPYFGEVYDLKVMLNITEDEQRKRILERPAFLHQRFFNEWIPMENRYFEGFNIAEKCDLVL